MANPAHGPKGRIYPAALWDSPFTSVIFATTRQSQADQTVVGRKLPYGTVAEPITHVFTGIGNIQ